MYEGILQNLIDEFGKLPGIGPKSAQRIAFYIVQSESYNPANLSSILATIRESIKFCEVCGNVADDVRGAICRDPRRRGAGRGRWHTARRRPRFRTPRRI